MEGLAIVWRMFPCCGPPGRVYDKAPFVDDLKPHHKWAKAAGDQHGLEHR